MQDTTKTYLSPEMYESIISFQEMRIESLEKKVKVLDHLIRLNVDPVHQAQIATDDWISNKLFG